MSKHNLSPAPTSRYRLLAVLGLALLHSACSHVPDASEKFELLTPATQLSPPDSVESNEIVQHGKYLVDMLGCGSCHTQGALEGAPDMSKRLAGSSTGITYSNPLTEKYPGVVYPANITPDEETGIGKWSDQQILRSITLGIGASGRQHLPVMPWPVYARLKEEDARAIVAYLRSLPPVKHRVPENVLPGHRAKSPYVHFGVYRSR